jgi:LAGLIDADG DNA endonuclease family
LPGLFKLPTHKQLRGEQLRGERGLGLFKSKGSNCSYTYTYRLRSFTFYSLNWMYDAFYPNKTRKVIPEFINIYLTPLALAV